uniref:Uncharacterized protein n=1 Tax=Vespula pensylvanica TaxID=30213 RepID=A0A834N9N5_VESPE|nr:hypothetical protein H0235_015246 [Vespula pensylvanica]
MKLFDINSRCKVGVSAYLSSLDRMLIVQRINKDSVQIKEESSSSSSWGRMPIVQASTKILKHHCNRARSNE